MDKYHIELTISPDNEGIGRCLRCEGVASVDVRHFWEWVGTRQFPSITRETIDDMKIIETSRVPSDWN